MPRDGAALKVTILRCSRCNRRLAVIESMKRITCDDCGAAYKLKDGKWIGDLERWTNKGKWAK